MRDCLCKIWSMMIHTLALISLLIESISIGLRAGHLGCDRAYQEDQSYVDPRQGSIARPAALLSL